MSEPEQHERIEPAAFEPPGSRGHRKRRRFHPFRLVAGTILGLLLGTLWFVFTARTVTLVFEPAADTVDIRGGLAVPFGGRFLVRPGDYTVVARKAGYHRLEEAVVVPSGEDPTFRFELRKLPGRLKVVTTPEGATVAIDGEVVGATPLDPVRLEPGRHELVLRARRHQPHEEVVEIEGREELQTLEVALVPSWAPVTVRSEPPGASLEVDGEERGNTPVTVELGAGTRALVLSLGGYEPWRTDLVVVADEPQELPVVELLPERGRLRVTSTPQGSNVTVDGEFQGRTPVTVRLVPGKATQVRLARAGYESTEQTISLASGEEEALAVELRPILGTVRVRATPPDATVTVDGEERGRARQDLSLTAAPHRIEIHKPGYVPYETSVTPKPGFVQEIEVTLLTEAEAAIQAVPAVIDTAAGRLRLVRPGTMTMGAPRREQGRRANEGERRVELTRLYYLGVHEVTNRAFRAFRPGHSSGIAERRKTLDNDDMPVVRVSWNDAVAFCNWLSAREGLPPAYEGGEIRTPVGTGYRLPTEAEWAWAARFAAGKNLKYPWGDRMPPTGRAGNYADVSSVGITEQRLREYDDGFPVSAPVGRFAPTPPGFFDLGGNVSEWVHDFYAGMPGGTGLETAPLGPESGAAHVVRGSSWRHGRITELRLSYREAGVGPRDDLGFRVARYAE